jgi:hypothetical protein
MYQHSLAALHHTAGQVQHSKIFVLFLPRLNMTTISVEAGDLNPMFLGYTESCYP